MIEHNSYKKEITTEDGFSIVFEDNGVGGRRYYSTECGQLIWDTCAVTEQMIQTALFLEQQNKIKSDMIQKRIAIGERSRILFDGVFVGKKDENIYSLYVIHSGKMLTIMNELYNKSGTLLSKGRLLAYIHFDNIEHFYDVCVALKKDNALISAEDL